MTEKKKRTPRKKLPPGYYKAELPISMICDLAAKWAIERCVRPRGVDGIALRSRPYVDSAQRLIVPIYVWKFGMPGIYTTGQKGEIRVTGFCGDYKISLHYPVTVPTDEIRFPEKQC